MLLAKAKRIASVVLFQAQLKRHGIAFGRRPSAWPRLPILIMDGGSMVVGDYFATQNRRFPVELVVRKGGRLVIGNSVSINNGTNIVCSLSIVIGDNTMIADLVIIRDHNGHEVDEGAGDPAKAVIIGRNVWIGSRAMIMKGVTIGAHSVVAAGAVVTKDVPERVVVGGCPATTLRKVICSDSFARC